MARLWQCGFEQNSTKEWDNYSAGTSIVTSPVNGGTYAAEFTGFSSGVAKSFDERYLYSGSGPYWCRFYFRYHALPSIAVAIFEYCYASAARPKIKFSSSGTLQIINPNGGTQVGSDSPALSADTWYCVEVKANYSGSSGTYEITGRLNGVVFATSTTLSLGNGPLGGIIIGGNLDLEANTAGDWFFDDIALNDGTGSYQNSWPGPGQIVHVHPNGAGDNNAFAAGAGGTAGATNNYTRVKEVSPDDATSYNSDATSGGIDDFAVGSSGIASGSTINVVGVGVRYAGASASSDAAFELRCKKTSGGTVSSSAAITPASTSYFTNGPQSGTGECYPLVLYNDPDGAAWTPTTLGTMQIGYEISTTGTNAAYISTLWASIDYAPAGYVDPFPLAYGGGSAQDTQKNAYIRMHHEEFEPALAGKLYLPKKRRTYHVL